MLHVGGAAVQAAYERCLVTPGHRREISTLITDLDGNVLHHSSSGLEERVLSGGEVNFDVKRKPRRILNLPLFDPRGHVDAKRSKMIQVIDSRFVSELGRWIDVEVFTGPIQPTTTRNGPELHIVAHGLEVQAMGAPMHTITIDDKTKKTAAIRRLLGSAGESFFGGIPDMPRTTAKRIVVHHLDPVWPVCERLAASMNRVLFYNGRGRPIMRPRSGKAVFEFDERHLLGEVEIGRPKELGPNTFECIGKDPKGPKKAPRAVAYLPVNHENSPHELKRNDQKLYIPRSEKREHAKTHAECAEVVQRWRKDAMRVQTTYQFDSIPIPHLEEYDLVRVKTSAGTIYVRMEQWTFPLSAEADPMTVGSDKVRNVR